MEVARLSTRYSTWDARRNADYWPGNVRVGGWAFLFHRITGLALIFYLLLHIVVISSVLMGGGSFDTVMSTLTTPFFLVVDLFLALAVIYHGLNGIRLILFDLGVAVKSQAALWWGVMALTALSWAWAWARVWPHIVGK